MSGVFSEDVKQNISCLVFRVVETNIKAGGTILVKYKISSWYPYPSNFRGNKILNFQDLSEVFALYNSIEVGVYGEKSITKYSVNSTAVRDGYT